MIDFDKLKVVGTTRRTQIEEDGHFYIICDYLTIAPDCIIITVQKQTPHGTFRLSTKVRVQLLKQKEEFIVKMLIEDWRERFKEEIKEL